MQQTTKYKLNLIEKTDTFSPDPLNENMEKVEAQFDAARAEAAAGDAAEAAARTAAVAALDARVQVLEVHRFYVGSYVGNGQYKRVVNLGFTPVAVLLAGVNESNTPHLFTRQAPLLYAGGIVVEIVENSLNIAQVTYSTANTSGKLYSYIAFT